MGYELFENAKKELFNKNNYIKNYIEYMLTKTNELFIYENIPDTIDIKRMEYFLQKNGFIFFTKNKDYHFYNGSLFDFDIYEEPTKINAILEDRSIKTYDVLKDGVLIKNDFLMNGLEKIFKKYGVMLCECEISLYLNSIMNRINYIINANDDNTKKSADRFIEKIYNGEFSIIGSNAFFDGVEIKGTTTQQNNTQSNIELTQYIKASAFNEIGLNSNFNMKRERLNTTELTLNENAIKPYIENMFNCRKQAIEKINELYGLNIIVSMSTIWDSYTSKPVEETTEEPVEETTEEPVEETTEEPVEETSNAPEEKTVEETSNAPEEKTVEETTEEPVEETTEEKKKKGVKNV